jgi:hypothetical protein
MHELHISGKETDRTVLVAAWRAVFEISFDRKPYLRKLTTNLMMTACVELYLYKAIAVGMGKNPVA